MRLSIITNYRGMLPFVQRIVAILSHTDLQINVIDYEDWAIRDHNGIVEKSYARGFHLALFSIPFIRIYAKRRLLFKMVSDLGAVDHCFILYIHPYVVANSEVIRRLAKKLVIAYAGSDFFRVSDDVRNRHRSLLDAADQMIFGSESFMDRVFSYWGDDYKSISTILALPNPQLNTMESGIFDRETFLRRLGLSHQKKTIAIGYNGIRQQQHLACLMAIRDILSKSSDFTILIQATYSFNSDYERELIELLENIGVQYRIIKDYMSEDQLSEFRNFCDIVINMQTTDAASSSLIEHLAGGAIVIVGEWLPYDHWRDMGIHYHKTSIERLPVVLQYCMEYLDSEKEMCLDNKKIIMDHYSTNKLAQQWCNVFGVVKDEL